MPSGRIEILNWREFQHYGKRRPPWIKLHRTLLEKREWYALSGDASKLLAECWLVASEHPEGWIEKSTADLAWRLRRTDKIQLARLLKELADNDFIALIDHDASTMLAGCQQDATPETERETEERQSSVLSERAPKPPKEKTDKQWKAAFAIGVREHLWLGNHPPARVLEREPDWDLGREVTIGEQWAKEHGGWDVACGVLELLRSLCGLDADVPMSCYHFHSKTNRARLKEAVGLYQKRAEHESAKKGSFAGLKVVNL